MLRALFLGEHPKNGNATAETIIKNTVTHFNLSGGDAETFAKLPLGDLSTVGIEDGLSLNDAT